MNVEILKSEKNYVEMLLHGEDHSIPNAICGILNEDEDVEFASYSIDHPAVSAPKLIVRTGKKDPIALISSAAKKLGKQAQDLSKSFEKKKK